MMVTRVLKVLHILQKQGSTQHGTGDKPATAQQQTKSVHRAVNTQANYANLCRKYLVLSH